MFDVRFSKASRALGTMFLLSIICLAVSPDVYSGLQAGGIKSHGLDREILSTLNKIQYKVKVAISSVVTLKESECLCGHISSLCGGSARLC